MSDDLDFIVIDDIPEYVFCIPDDEESENVIPVKGEDGSFKYEKVAELPETGEDGVLYLVPKPHETQTASGNPISITVSDKAGDLDDIKLLGNATQATYSGKNLFDYPSMVATQGGGLTWSLGDDGYFTISGTLTTSYTNIVSAYNITDMLVDGQTYTISTSGTGNQYAYTMLAMTNIGTGTSQYHGASTSPYTFTVDKSTYTYRLNAQTTTTATWGSTSRTLKVGFQLEKSATATDFEKYVGGTASPNPDYPQEIQTVTGEQTVKVVGKNLLPYDQHLNLTWGNTNTNMLNLLNTLSAGTYTFSCKFRLTERNDTTDASKYGWYFVYDGGGFISRPDWGSATVGTEVSYSLTFTITDAIVGKFTRVYVYGCGVSGATGKADALDIQLELGNSASSFEPYTEQSQEIYIAGKNLATNGGWGRGQYYNGAWSNDLKRVTTGFIQVGGNTYTMKLNSTEEPKKIAFINLNYFDENKSWLGNRSTIGLPAFTNTQREVTFTLPSTAKWLRVSMRSYGDSGASEITIEECKNSLLQVEQGETATAYEAPLELAKIGTYQDRIYKDGEKWYIEKQVGKVVLDGTNASFSSANNGFVCIYTQATSPFYGKIALGEPSYQSICDHFTVRPNGTTWTGRGKCGFNSAGAFWLMHTDTTITAVAGFNTWLASNPTTVYYALATPTTTEITDQTLIDQLEAARNAALANGTNVISNTATGNNLAGDLELSYYEYDPTNKYNKWLWLDDDAAYEQM